jgi:hypothetical protein
MCLCMYPSIYRLIFIYIYMYIYITYMDTYIYVYCIYIHIYGIWIYCTYIYIHMDLCGFIWIYVVKLNKHVTEVTSPGLACGVLMPETSPICSFRRPRSSCKGSNCSCSWTSNLPLPCWNQQTVSQKPTKLF